MTKIQATPERLLATQAAKEYAEFLAKFEAKKTTDDCFTPPEVFAAVHEWAATEYELQDRRIVRPFHPGGDFVAFDYQPGDVVLDNPPFSIITKIILIVSYPVFHLPARGHDVDFSPME